MSGPKQKEKKNTSQASAPANKTRFGLDPTVSPLMFVLSEATHSQTTHCCQKQPLGYIWTPDNYAKLNGRMQRIAKGQSRQTHTASLERSKQAHPWDLAALNIPKKQHACLVGAPPSSCCSFARHLVVKLVIQCSFTHH